MNQIVRTYQCLAVEFLSASVTDICGDTLLQVGRSRLKNQHLSGHPLNNTILSQLVHEAD